MEQHGNWDWKLFFATFTTIFIAEMGDKTQFAALAASSQSRSTLSVWLAVVLALGLAGTLGVLAGRVVGEFISPEMTKRVSGALFILIGVWILFSE